MSRTRIRAGVLAVLVGGCASPPPPPPEPPVAQGPDDAILAIASNWEARAVDKGLRSKPSPIASFESTVSTRIELVKDETRARETSHFAERFVMRDGAHVECSTSLESAVEVSYGRRQGEAALEIGWAPISTPRICNVPDARIPPLEVPGGRSRFVLRSDQLVGVEPPLETRSFLPAN